MRRVTEAELERVVLLINTASGMPTKPYVDGKAQVGNYYLDYAYGGVCLRRMYNDAGAATNPISSGYVTKRELIGLMRAFLEGIAVKA